MSKFQIVLLAVFGIFIVVAVGVFALYKGNSGSSATVMVWGDIPGSQFDRFLADTNLSQDQTLSIRYAEHRPDSLENDFTEALAQGNGPDLIILTQDKFYKNKNKLVPIPYKSVSQKDYQNTFVEAGEVFETGEGIYALPISIDPLVLYYNRDLLSSAGIANPLSYWDELYNQTLKLSTRDGAGNLTKSAISLGETRNIKNFKDILSLLLIQAGNPITDWSGNTLRSLLSENFGLPVSPADSALSFYTQFSNPTKPYYSWNRTLPEAQTRFSSGDLSYYLGYASELPLIRGKSPTLNFSVSSVPQSRVSGRTITFAKVRGVAISRGARDPAAAFNAALKLISAQNAQKLSELTGLPPARRDLLANRPTDAVTPVFYDAALQAKVWLDPNATLSAKIFSDMVDAITSGRARTSETISRGNEELNSLIDK